MSTEAPNQVYFTILAENYLPKAMALAGSLQRHMGLTLKALLIDCETEADLPQVDGIELLSTDVLGFGPAELHRMTMTYGLVEFATAVKPKLMLKLLEEYDQCSYLDPDTYLTAPMEELGPDTTASDSGILLTPHFLVPPPADAFTSENHLLHVGFYNLGFIATDRRAIPFLEWWWGRLREECLFDMLGGLFVDQKWVDMGSAYFGGTNWKHPGYNVSIVNLHERPVSLVDGTLRVGHDGQPLRLFHFHAFDPNAPEELSTRFKTSTSEIRKSSEALDDLCHQYAGEVLAAAEKLRPAPEYRYNTDTLGKNIGRQVRRAYRMDSAGDPHRLPSAFDPAQRDAYAKWRRTAFKRISKEMAGDAAKVARMTTPVALRKVQNALPGITLAARRKFVSKGGIWG